MHENVLGIVDVTYYSYLINYWSSYSFTTIVHNAKQVFKQCIESCPNSLILMFSSLQAGCVGCI